MLTKFVLIVMFYRISSAVFIAFVARGVSSIPSGMFCYSAIASAAIVKLLPKYLIICGSLELASKNSQHFPDRIFSHISHCIVITGSVKMVYAIIWSLFLGFSITLGR